MDSIEGAFHEIFRIVSRAFSNRSIEDHILFTNRFLFLISIQSMLKLNHSSMMDIAKLLWKKDVELFNSKNFSELQRKISENESRLELNKDVIDRWSIIYEQYVSENLGSDGKKRGFFFTSNDEIRFMISRTLFYFYLKRFNNKDLSNFIYSLDAQQKASQNNLILINLLCNSKLIDISCGSGLFLTEYADFLLNKLELMDLTNIPNYERVLKQIFGIDIMESAIELTRFRLILMVLQRMKEKSLADLLKLFEITNRNIIHADALSSSVILEFRSHHKRFDFLIGNPPYVKPDNICDKMRLKSEITQLFNGTELNIEIPNTSDYYIYFFYYAFHYIKDNGIISLLTSNSWLDVKYGYPFQRFLLDSSNILEIVECQSNKSFTSADINTIITILQPKFMNKTQSNSIHKIRFIGLEHPYSFYIQHYKQSNWDSEFESIRTANVHLKIIPPDFLRNLGTKGGKYIGVKWGSMVLRAPDILLRILDTKKTLFCHLNELAEVKTGVYTGLNEFFYMTKEKAEKYGILKDFLVPILRDSDDIQSYEIEPPSTIFLLKVPSVSKSELTKRCLGLVRYIEEGETNTTKEGQKTKGGLIFSEVPSVKPRKFWYSIPEVSLQPANLFMQYIAHTRFYCPFSRVPVLSDRSFHRIYPKQEVSVRALAAVLNSSLQILFVLTSGRYNLGGGALKFETMDAKNVFTLDLRKLPQSVIQNLEQGFEHMKKNIPMDIYHEFGIINELDLAERKLNIVKERKYIDDLIFDVLDIHGENEKREIYDSIIRLIEMRQKKART
jgi:type I restriction enzyme M protein